MVQVYDLERFRRYFGLITCLTACLATSGAAWVQEMSVVGQEWDGRSSTWCALLQCSRTKAPLALGMSFPTSASAPNLSQGIRDFMLGVGHTHGGLFQFVPNEPASIKN